MDDHVGADGCATIDLVDGRVRCQIRLTTSPADESLARVVNVLRRTRWSVRELHQRAAGDHNELFVEVVKLGGRTDVLLAQLQREVLVIDSWFDGRDADPTRR